MLLMLCCSISIGLEFWSVNHTSIHKNSESNVLKNIKLSGEIFDNWPKDLLGTNVYKILNFFDNYYWQHYNVLILLH